MAANRQAVSQVVSVPSPFGGWNARDSLEAMAPTDAILMDNFFPGFSTVDLRAGYSEFVASGMGSGNVDTLAEFHAGATRKFVAGANGNLYDITSGTASSLASGFSSDRWEWVNFNGSMGFVNGADAPQTYDGSTVGAMTISGTGLTVASIVGIEVYRSRTWFWMANSQSAWYSAVNALGGTTTEFPLSRVGQFGGNLVAVGTWSLGGASDTWGGGGDIRDVIAFVMSSGEVIIYEGSDPGSDFVLIGVYQVAAPLDVRGVTKINDDLVVVTIDGYIPLSQVLRQGRLAANSAVSDKIRKAVRDAASDFSANTGWQSILYDKGGYYLVNVPRSTTLFEQHVMNTATGAWCRFTNQNARCWGTYSDALYFGTTDGKVMLADSGLTDNATNIGGNSGAEVRQAATSFGIPLPKQLAAIRPIFSGTGDVSIGIAVEADFQQSGAAIGEVSIAAPTANWQDVDVLWQEWDDDWNTGAEEAFSRWIIRTSLGVRLNARILVTIQDKLKWFSTDYRLQAGNAL